MSKTKKLSNKTMIEEKKLRFVCTELQRKLAEIIRPVLKGYIKHVYIQPFWLLRFTDYVISLMLRERLKIK